MWIINFISKDRREMKTLEGRRGDKDEEKSSGQNAPSELLPLGHETEESKSNMTTFGLRMLQSQVCKHAEHRACGKPR
jgi:hypothetical protein